MILKILNKLPVSFYLKTDPKKVIGAYYHYVSDETPDFLANIYSHKNPKQFREDLAFIKKHYNTIHYKDFANNKIRKKSFILTFDDGFRNLKTEILPILEEFEIPAIFFITTDVIDNKEWMYRNLTSIIIEKIKNENLDFPLFLGHENIESQEKAIEYLLSIFNNKELIFKIAAQLDIPYQNLLSERKPYLDKDEIIELSKHPLITIGAHSRSHYYYKLLDSDAVKEDIVQSCKEICEITNQEFVPFAFPHNSKGVSRKILEDISTEFDFIRGFFGEFNYEEDLVIKRHSLDEPTLSIEKRIFTAGKNHWYEKYKNLKKKFTKNRN